MVPFRPQDRVMETLSKPLRQFQTLKHDSDVVINKKWFSDSCSWMMPTRHLMVRSHFACCNPSWTPLRVWLRGKGVVDWNPVAFPTAWISWTVRRPVAASKSRHRSRSRYCFNCSQQPSHAWDVVLEEPTRSWWSQWGTDGKSSDELKLPPSWSVVSWMRRRAGC